MATCPLEAQEVKSLKESTLNQAENAIFQTFPKKIKEFGDVLESPMFSTDNLSQIHSDIHIPVPLTTPPYVNGDEESLKSGIKKRKMETVEEDVYPLIGQKIQPCLTEIVPSNSKIEKIIDYIKPEVIAVINHCSTIKLWIQLMIPKIEDGNNFGVSIQEEILSEVTKAESDASTYLDQTTRYFSSRAKMLSKVAKYPHLSDYRRAIKEYDEKVFFSFKLILTELRNIYVILYDVILKNYQKLKQPRSSNSTALY